MTRSGLQSLFDKYGIMPTPQRVEIAAILLERPQHLSAEHIIEKLKDAGSCVSKATVYNTLNLFAEKGLLKRHLLTEGRLVFDPNVTPHHHFIDEATGEIHDIPWDQVDVSDVEKLEGFDVTEFQVVMRGRRKPAKT